MRIKVKGWWEPPRPTDPARRDEYLANPHASEEWFECILDFPIVPSIGDSIPMGRDDQPVRIEDRSIYPQPDADLCITLYLGSFTGDRDHVARLFDNS